MTPLAPVAVFAYSRPNHLRRTLTSLKSCEGFVETPITVFIDGPRTPEKAEAVQAVQQVALQTLGSAVEIRLSPTNLGLSRSITTGVTELVSKYGRVIVVEDDLELAPCFLRYMNAALDRYADYPQVFQVSGYMFDVPNFASRKDAMFLPITTTWGWATWSRAWKAYDPLALGWQRLLSDRDLRRRFNLYNRYDFVRLLQRHETGKSDSWGIRWYWSVFQQDGLCLFPPQSLVHNTGQDGSGTHGGGILGDFSAQDSNFLQAVLTMPETIAVSETDLAAIRDAVWRQNGGRPGWMLSKIRGWLGQ